MLRKYLQCFFLCIGTNAYCASALDKRLYAACRNQRSAMERSRNLCFLAVLLAGKCMAFVFCHRLQKQDINVITIKKLLGEAIFLHGRGENRHGCNSTWGDCGEDSRAGLFRNIPQSNNVFSSWAPAQTHWSQWDHSAAESYLVLC